MPENTRSVCERERELEYEHCHHLALVWGRCPSRNSNLAPSDYKATAVPLKPACSVHSSYVTNLPLIEGSKPCSRVHQFHVGCLTDLALCVSYRSLQVIFPFQISFINLYLTFLLPHDCKQCIGNVCGHYTKMANYVSLYNAISSVNRRILRKIVPWRSCSTIIACHWRRTDRRELEFIFRHCIIDYLIAIRTYVTTFSELLTGLVCPITRLCCFNDDRYCWQMGVAFLSGQLYHGR